MSGAIQHPATDPATTGGNPDGNGPTNPTPSAAADPNSEAMRIISEATGRNYQSLEDAAKHVKNLNSLVGNPRLREDADLADRIVSQYASENSLTRAEARAKLAELAGSEPKLQQRAGDDVPSHVLERMERLETDAFLARNPDAAQHLEKVRTYARATGKDLADAYSELYSGFSKAPAAQNPVDDRRAQKLATQVPVSSSAMPAASVDKLAQMKAQYAKTGNPQLMRDIIKAKADREV